MSEYLQYLIWMMLFVIVIEMIFPDSSYRKYIKLVLGCILVYTMLSPIIQWIRIDGENYKDYVQDYQKLLGIESGGVAESYDEQVKQQQAILEAMYQKNMTQTIEEQFDIKVVSLQLKMKDSQMEQVNLTVTRSDASIQVGEIHIGDKSHSADGADEALKNKIKTCLNDFYNVQDSNIYITVQKN